MRKEMKPPLNLWAVLSETMMLFDFQRTLICTTIEKWDFSIHSAFRYWLKSGVGGGGGIFDFRVLIK